MQVKDSCGWKAPVWQKFRPWLANVLFVVLAACGPLQPLAGKLDNAAGASCPQTLAAFAPAWLEKPASLEQLEFALCEDLPTLRRVHRCLQPGDEIWTFVTPPETWNAGVGRAGFAIVRNGQVVGNLLRCAE